MVLEERIFVFAFNQDDRPLPRYVGHFNGDRFIPKLGFCHSLDELYKYDYIELYGMDGMVEHLPKRFYGNLINRMESAFVREYGEQQIEMF